MTIIHIDATFGFLALVWGSATIGLKLVCSSYCFYADLTIYEFCNTKRVITVITVVEGLTNKVI